MADLPPYSTPRWVKIIGTIALVLVLLLGILHLAGLRPNHGPARHLPSGHTGNPSPLSITVNQTPFACGSTSHMQLIQHGMHEL